MAATIHIIGLGVDAIANVSNGAAMALQQTEVVVGWQRHREMITPLLNKHKFVEVKKLSELKHTIESLKVEYQHIAVVASGDPLHFGIGRWLTQQFSDEQLCFYPAVSSIQAACHQQGLSMQDVEVLSLHGRPVEQIRPSLKNHKTLVVLTDQQSQPKALAQECDSAGFKDACITVHEAFGYPQQQSTSFSIQQLLAGSHSFDPLHVSVLQLGVSDSHIENHQPEFPGFIDALYETGKPEGKGMISKREVRLTILSMLQPAAGDIIWDVGAGCGGVAVELAYWNRQLDVYAIEYHPERLQYLNQNQQKFGVTNNLHIIEAKAPAAFADLPMPNKVFIGGSDGKLLPMLEAVWDKIGSSDVLVASAVVQNSKDQLAQFAEKIADQGHHIEMIELGVKRAVIKNGHWQQDNKLPVEIYKFVKANGNLVNLTGDKQ